MRLEDVPADQLEELVEDLADLRHDLGKYVCFEARFVADPGDRAALRCRAREADRLRARLWGDPGAGEFTAAWWWNARCRGGGVAWTGSPWLTSACAWRDLDLRGSTAGKKSASSESSVTVSGSVECDVTNRASKPNTRRWESVGPAAAAAAWMR